MEHAQSALILLQEELFSGAMSGGDGNNGVAQKVDRIAVLAIAYHNIGVEQEFLKRHEQSLHSYRKGVDIAETHLGNDHGITITLRTCKCSPGWVLAKNCPLFTRRIPAHPMLDRTHRFESVQGCFY